MLEYASSSIAEISSGVPADMGCKPDMSTEFKATSVRSLRLDFLPPREEVVEFWEASVEVVDGPRDMLRQSAKMEVVESSSGVDVGGGVDSSRFAMSVRFMDDCNGECSGD
mmetsp:Transcript_9894/g.20123  ORF Transcript_9894/g.20123 Transcript_9894/m.20123 type:complete len:111 (+) Transcript_9894:366-698(+)